VPRQIDPEQGAITGLGLYRWWALEEDAVFVDDVWLEER
jgi:hypothetical protein